MPHKGAMGNTNHTSLPNSDGMPLLSGWKALRLSGCLFLQSQPFTLPAPEVAPRGGGGAWRAAMALPPWHCMAFSAGARERSTVKPAGQKGQPRQPGSVCVSCSVVPLECAVSQWAAQWKWSRYSQAGFLQGCYLEKHTSKWCRLKLLSAGGRENHGYSHVQLNEAGLVEQIVFLPCNFRGRHCGELKSFLIVSCSLSKNSVWCYSGTYISKYSDPFTLFTLFCCSPKNNPSPIYIHYSIDAILSLSSAAVHSTL